MNDGEEVESIGTRKPAETISPCPPGSVIGMLGGGQLGRMFAIEARKLGYGVQVFEPTPDCPASHVADRQFARPYSDAAAMREFAATSDVITYEFENIPVGELGLATLHVPIRPSLDVLHTCQNRRREKEFLAANGVPCVPFAVVRNADDLDRAMRQIEAPAVLKTAEFGYDGKGQIKVVDGAAPADVWRAFGAPAGVLEKWLDLDCELSVVCARGLDGATVAFPVAENIHARHVLEYSIVPARIPDDVQRSAVELAKRIAETLDVAGVLTVEFFLTRGGELLVNELAPRPHNSGHYSFDACITSQFEQQVRAICGLPLGSVELLRPVVMVNLLGDLWARGELPWATLLSDPLVKLHLYGKVEPRPGRKMGHFCVFGDSARGAYDRARLHKQLLLDATA